MRNSLLRFCPVFLRGGKQRGLIVIKSSSYRRGFCFLRESVDLDGAISFVFVDAEFARRGVDAVLLMPRTSLASIGQDCFLNLRKLSIGCRLPFLLVLIVRQPDPLGNVMRSFLNRQVSPVQVFCNLPVHLASRVGQWHAQLAPGL
jgi:hypothetical protein